MHPRWFDFYKIILIRIDNSTGAYIFAFLWILEQKIITN